MSYIKSILFVLLCIGFFMPLYSALYQQKKDNQKMKAFCTQTLLGKSINEITEMMSKNTQLKIYKQQNNAYQFLNEMIIYSQ